MLFEDKNDEARQIWLSTVLKRIENGSRLLDAGAGELRNRSLCEHLDYVAQDFNQYEGSDNGHGLHGNSWDTSGIDIVCDITNIPEPDGSFDVVPCSEVLEHVPNPESALDELARLPRPGGKLILTAPFASLTHFAPYHFCTGFSRYWYEHHLNARNFRIQELSPNGDWFAYCRQEVLRLGRAARRYGDWSWPLAYLLGVLGALYFCIRGGRDASDLACFGWHVVAIKG